MRVPQPWLKGIDDLLTFLLPNGATFVGAAAADVFLDGVEHGDMFERFAGDGRRTGCGELVKVTPDMRPAERQPDVAALRQLAVAGIAIDLQNSLESPSGGRSAARLCGRVRRHRQRSADPTHPRDGRRRHKPKAGRSWYVLGRDRGPARWSRPRTAWAIASVSGGDAHATGAGARRHGRPSRPAWSDPVPCPGERKSGTGDRAADGRHIWTPELGRPWPRSAGRPRSVALAPALARHRPRKSGRHIWVDG